MDLNHDRRRASIQTARRGSVGATTQPHRRSGTPATAGAIASVGLILRLESRVLWTSGNSEWIHLVETLYVRAANNRVVELDLAPSSPAWWATHRALIVLDDPRDPAQCRLLLRGTPLPPYRSLAGSAVRNGDTLDLVAADTIPHHSSGLHRRLYSRALARLNIHKR